MLHLSVVNEGMVEHIRMQQLYCAAYSMLHWYNIFAAEVGLDLVFLSGSNESHWCHSQQKSLSKTTLTPGHGGR